MERVTNQGSWFNVECPLFELNQFVHHDDVAAMTGNGMRQVGQSTSMRSTGHQ